jgi:hypothetical protein
MTLKKMLPVIVAGAAMLAAPLSASAGERHRDGKLTPAEAEGIAKQKQIGEYNGRFHSSPGDRANLDGAWFEYEFSPASNIGNAAPNTPCYLDRFTLDINRDNDKDGKGGGVLHLAGTGVDCIVEPGHSIQNFVYYVAKDGEGCFSTWKRGRGTGNLTSDTIYQSDKKRDLKSILHLDGNLMDQRTERDD